MQARYSAHRTGRRKQQNAILLSPNFQDEGLNVDSILQRLEDPTLEPGFVDPRHSLVFWARPSPGVKDLIIQIQQRLKAISPHLWLMPTEKQHITIQELAHSLPEEAIAAITKDLMPAVPDMTDVTNPAHRARLIRPQLAHDRAGIALCFVPAAGEGLPSAEEPGRRAEADNFTYHHLRGTVYGRSMSTPVKIQSRYIVPSAHITVGRFITREDHDTPEKMKKWVEGIEAIDAWLEQEYWPKEGQSIRSGGEWVVGKGSGLICRIGRLWYGGGETVRQGEGFQ